MNSNGKLSVRKRFSIRQKSLTLHSSFCPVVSQRQGFCIVSASEDMCGKRKQTFHHKQFTVYLSFFVVYLYDIDREIRTLINKLQGHCSAVFDVSFNSDESLLASCDQQGLVIVWQRDNR